MNIKFFTPVYFENAKSRTEALLQTVDSYFSFGGKRACVILDQQKIKETILIDGTSPPHLSTALKVISYFTIIIPIIMLVAKIILRSLYTFRLNTVASFYEAIREKETNKSLKLIEELDSNRFCIQDIERYILLYLAITYSEQKVALKLIKKSNSEIFCFQDPAGDTLLHRALKKEKQFEVTLALISKQNGKACCIQNDNGDTPLHLAIKSGRRKAAIALIAKLNSEGLCIQNREGNTPLHSAILVSQREAEVTLSDANAGLLIGRRIFGGIESYQETLEILEIKIAKTAQKILKKIFKKSSCKALGIPNKKGLTPISVLKLSAHKFTDLFQTRIIKKFIDKSNPRLFYEPVPDFGAKKEESHSSEKRIPSLIELCTKGLAETGTQFPPFLFIPLNSPLHFARSGSKK